MPLKTDLNYSACNAKCKCLTGSREGTIYDCNNPCSESFEIFDEYDCSCGNAMPAGEYKYEATITFISNSGQAFFTPIDRDFTLNANTLVGVIATPVPGNRVDFSFSPNTTFSAGLESLVVTRSQTTTGCVDSVQFQLQFQDLQGGNVVQLPLGGIVMDCSTPSGTSASISGIFTRTD